MSETRNVYTWVHPDVLKATRGENDLGYMIRDWLQMSVDLDNFSITRARNFFGVEEGMQGISGTRKIEELFSSYDAMTDVEKKAYGSRQRRLAEVIPFQELLPAPVDGYALTGSGILRNGDTLFIDHVQDLDGKSSTPWHVPLPSEHTRVRVTLGPPGKDRTHGGISYFEHDDDPAVSIVVPSDALEGVLDDLNRSSEKKKIVVRFSVLLYSFPDADNDGSSASYCLLPRGSYGSAILNEIDVIAYERDLRESREKMSSDGRDA